MATKKTGGFAQNAVLSVRKNTAMLGVNSDIFARIADCNF